MSLPCDVPAPDLYRATRDFLDALAFVRIRAVAETTGAFGPAGPAANAFRSALLAGVWRSPFGRRLRAAAPGERGNPPFPYALRPPCPSVVRRPGELVAFEVVSFWTDADALAGWRSGLLHAFSSGIGRQRSPLRELSMEATGPQVLGGAADARWGSLGGGTCAIEARFVTPTFLRADREVVVPDPAGTIAATLRRVRLLAMAFGREPPRVPFDEVAVIADGTRSTPGYREAWSEVRARRRQSATGRLLPVEGLTGSWCGSVDRIPGLVLAAAEIVQVGKGTTWGQGVVELLRA